jgi:alkylation response protein AidB-like acyl-CoA dehydrogenase
VSASATGGFPALREEKRQVLLQSVKDVAETVTALAEEAEAQSTLPPQMVAALQAAGLFKLKLPAELGGADADPVTQLDVIEALAYLYPSAGWVVMTNATAIGTIGAFLPDETIRAIFAGGYVPRAATVGGVSSTASPVEGGYRVSGRWSFVSGVPHADWISLGSRVAPEAGGPPQILRCVVPAASAQIHDNWQVAGLKGSGSCDVSLEDVFVPEAFTWDAGDRTRGEPKRGGPIFLLGLPGFVSNEHAAFALGVGRRALDLIVDAAQSKRRGRGAAAVTLGDRPVFQGWVGEADLRLRAVRALAVEVHEKAWQTVSAGHYTEARLEAEMRASAVLCTQAAVEIATQAFRFAGGAALFLNNELQRCMRDVNAGAQHLAVSEVAYENHGRFVLGLAEASPYY